MYYTDEEHPKNLCQTNRNNYDPKTVEIIPLKIAII